MMEPAAAVSENRILVGVVMPGPKAGGVRQSAQGMLDDLLRAGFRVGVCTQEPEEPASFPAGTIIVQGPQTCSGVRRLVRYGLLAAGIQDGDGRAFEARARAAGVQVLVYPTPIACSPPREIPYAVVIPDLMHRYYPELPEYRWPKPVARNIVYGRYARDAARVIVDAEHGAGDVQRFLGVARTQCRVVPFRPPPSVYQHRDLSRAAALAMMVQLKLPPKFLFYPAQLWAHKNHARLLQALAMLRRERGLQVPLVCAGFTEGPFAAQAKKVEAEVVQLGIGGQVQFTGYVSAAELAALYRLARALIFPSLLGPTNIPPLEAMVLGTPVLCSNLFGMPDQIGDAGILFDPFDPRAIADAIERIWDDDALVATLAERGRRRMASLAREDSGALLQRVVVETLAAGGHAGAAL
jgi:glycosyltransferase involved in cell wall biosynthesis